MGDRTAQMCELMRFESNRLRSFQMNPPWPKDYVDIKKLAKAGFFYVFSGDNVLCAFCRGQVCRWERDDDPMTEHARHFTTCPFIMGGEVGNVPLGDDPIPGPKRPRAYDVCGRYPNFPPEDQRSLEEQFVHPYNWPIDERTNNDNSSNLNSVSTSINPQSNYSSNNGNLGQVIHDSVQFTSRDNGPPRLEGLQSQRTLQALACEEDTRSSTYSSSSSSSSSTSTTSSITQALSMPMMTETTIQNPTIREPSQTICKICYTNSIELAFLPCGHTVSCLSCAQRIYTCPCCRVTISSRIRLYFA